MLLTIRQMLDALWALICKILDWLNRLVAALRRSRTLSLASLSQETLEVGDRRFRVIKWVSKCHNNRHWRPHGIRSALSTPCPPVQSPPSASPKA